MRFVEVVKLAFGAAALEEEVDIMLQVQVDAHSTAQGKPAYGWGEFRGKSRRQVSSPEPEPGCPGGLEWPVMCHTACEQYANHTGQIYRGITNLVNYPFGCSDRRNHQDYAGVWFNDASAGGHWSDHKGFTGEVRRLCSDYQFGGCPTDPTPVGEPGLKFEYFEFRPGLEEPYLADLTPKLVGVDAKIDFAEHGNLDEHHCAKGPCATRADNFVLRWTGFIEITQNGTYEFSTSSDDGSWMSLNGYQFVNNGGYHGMSREAANVNLVAGRHRVEMKSSELEGGWGMIWKYKGPDSNNLEVVVPQGVLFQPVGVDNFECPDGKQPFNGACVTAPCQEPEPDSCVQWSMVVHHVNHARPGFPDLPGYTVNKTYEISEGGHFKDAAWLYRTNCGHCTMLFRGSDYGWEQTINGDPTGDYLNNFNPTPIDKWGISGIHAGVATELEGLLALMDFQEIRYACPGKFSVVGASLGGALASLFAILLTQDGDVLDARLKLHELNTFGSYASTTSPASNDQSADGCFAGSQYWYAQALAGGFVVDSIASPLVGGGVHHPVRGNKVFTEATPDGGTTYPCDTPLPDDLVDLAAHLAPNFAQWIQYHSGYGKWLGCAGF